MGIGMVAPLPPASASAGDALLALLTLVSDPQAAKQQINSLREIETAARHASAEAAAAKQEAEKAHRELQAAQAAHNASVQAAHDDIHAKRAAWAKELKEVQDHIASEKAAVEQEKVAVTKLRQSLEARLSRIASAAAA